MKFLRLEDHYVNQECIECIIESDMSYELVLTCKERVIVFKNSPDAKLVRNLLANNTLFVDVEDDE